MMSELGAEIIKIAIAPVDNPAWVIPRIRDRRSGYCELQIEALTPRGVRV